MAAIEPMEQFLVRKVVDLPVTLPGVGVVNLGINNSVLFMLISAAIVVAFLSVAARREMVPGRWQAAAEALYTMVDGTLTGGIIGDRGRPFLPLVFTLFLFISIMNVIGLTPGVGFTATSQLAVTVTLAFMTFAIVLVVGFARNGLGFFKLFWPSNMNIVMAAFLCVIEFISFAIRPFTLAMRLFGNMLGGHIVMFVFASFIVAMGAFALQGGLASVGFIGSAMSFAMVMALLLLEMVVALLQAFVFAILTCIYLSEVVNLDHGH